MGWVGIKEKEILDMEAVKQKPCVHILKCYPRNENTR
jgi:hypothetical protein